MSSGIFRRQTIIYKHQISVFLTDHENGQLIDAQDPDRRTTKSIPGRSPFPRPAYPRHCDGRTRIQGTSPSTLLIHASCFLVLPHCPTTLPARRLNFLIAVADKRIFSATPNANCYAAQASAASGTTTPSEPDSRKDAETQDTTQF